VTFSNNRVLRDVALEVRPGELHALVGQNGSGKSTLAKVLTGLYTPDPGAVVAVDGAPLRLPVRPEESRAAGVAVVHQSLGLLGAYSVLENMRMGRLRGTGPLRRIRWDRERAEAAAVFERLGRSVPLEARVGALSEEDRATVAIARALQDARPGTGLIIFDESTRALGRRALEHFFQILDEIVDTGTSVLLITHRLEEVVDAADRVTILRDGRAVERGLEVEGLTEAELTALILGRNLSDLDRRAPADIRSDETPVRVTGVRGLDVAEASFELRRGEVLGLTGLAGSGYDDVPYLLSGVTPAAAGTLTFGGRELQLSNLTPADAIAAGIALVPEGREHAGLAMGLAAGENMVFPQSARSTRGLAPLSRADEKSLVETWMQRLDVRPRQPQNPANTFSGGNQQKIFISKWLATGPSVLLLHEPTQAVDIGARHTIVAAVRQAAAAGSYVLVAGSDENELALLCDRVLVFEEGRIARELTDHLTPDTIVAGIYTGASRTRLRRRSAGGAPAGDAAHG
jgi:ribose transport system ATP-binding protein